MFGLFKRKAKSVKARAESAIAKRFPPDSKYLKGNETTDEEWKREQKEQRLQKKLAGLLGAAVVLLKVFGVDVPIDPHHHQVVCDQILIHTDLYNIPHCISLTSCWYPQG